MNYIELILKNTSLWEVVALIIVFYFVCRPSLLKTITRLKVGDLEIELNALREKVAQSESQIDELEAELENERRLFEDLLENFDPNASLAQLAETRKAIKTQAKNLEEVDALKNYLTPGTKPEDLYAVAVAIRERRPVTLIPDIVAFLDKLAADIDLGNYRLNTIWTLTSALHLCLLAAIRDEVSPKPDAEVLQQAERMLDKLENNPSVQADRPDNPMKGIRGPIKHCRSWIKKGLAEE